MYKSVFNIRITSLYGSQPSSVVLHENNSFWTRITSFYGYQTSPVVLCIQISVIRTRITSLYGFQPSFVVLRSQNSDLKTKIACVYGTQTALLIFFISLYGSQPLSVVFACKTAPFGAELQVSMCSRPYPSFYACKTAWVLNSDLATSCLGRCVLELNAGS